MRTMLPRAILAAISIILTADAGFSTVYHVSNNGNDKNDGKSPQKAWATLARVNAGPLRPGDSVLFHRGDAWRGQIIVASGAKNACVTYADYGAGVKPLVLGSVSKSNAADWTDVGGDIWSTAGPGVDVGNIIFGNESQCGIKVWSDAELAKDGYYWYDQAKNTIRLRMSENPAKRFNRIECAVDKHVVFMNKSSYVNCRNLVIKYGAAHGISAITTNHITIRDCDIGFIGGGILRGYGNGRVRFGNGIEFWDAARDCLVERCRVWEIYDAALSNQNGQKKTPQINIVYRNNIVWNAEYSFEYWNRPESSETRDIHFVNNTCVNAGGGWGHAQRPDPSGYQVLLGKNTAKTKNVVIRNNIFDGATKHVLMARDWKKTTLLDAVTIDCNCWRQSGGVMINLLGETFSADSFGKYQSEWKKDSQSIRGDPMFVDGKRFDFHLAPNSPCLKLGCGANFDHD